jgi:hypothetical protein
MQHLNPIDQTCLWGENKDLNTAPHCCDVSWHRSLRLRSSVRTCCALTSIAVLYQHRDC